MGSLYRSEPMSLCQLFLQTDSAFASVAELGELGLCQFRDLNPEASSYQRKYVHEVRRCDEMERKLRMVTEELTKDGIPIPDYIDQIPAPMPRDMNELEAKFDKLEEELSSINLSTKSLKDNYLQLTDIKNVLNKVRVLFDEGQRTQAFQSISDAQHGYGPIQANGNAFVGDDFKDTVKKETELKFVAGVIRRDRISTFERILWRLCKGNVYVRTNDIEFDPQALFHDDVEKSVFLLFFSGDRLTTRVKKICDGFRTHVIQNCPEAPAERNELLISVTNRLEDMRTVIGKTLEHRERVLNAASLNMKSWEIQVLKLKAIFHTLNLFNLDVTQKCLIAECWVPTNEIGTVQSALRHATQLSGSNVQSILNRLDTHSTPPTYHKLNKFTRGFQNIVDSYGIASYREINPAPWTIISFPFLFAVMFGDTGHGVIMILAALAFILNEKRIEKAKIKDEIFNTFYGGRYVVVLMGCFSIYTGLVYNDIYSKSINIFGSGWKNPYNHELLKNLSKDAATGNQVISLTFPPEVAFDDSKNPYPFGVDPAWNIADNRLNFLNPMKMKMSVLLGISQMTFGLILSLFNHIYFGSMVDVFFVFIPQMLFLSLIFIYLCAQIVIKWITYYVRPGMKFDKFYPGSHCAPSLLIGLINMFMMKAREDSFGTTYPNGTFVESENQCYQQLWYPHQDIIEKIFLFIAVISIPVMLFVKPFVLRYKHARGEHVHVHGAEEGAEFNFGDAMVYQGIHTIEFALGCISHTASYLRLWALSLAHSELSDVLWTMVMRQAFTMDMGYGGAILCFVVFWVFSMLTVAILILMEGLSAFLHALRLHWVEFQSKFYAGTGVQFEPFYFTRIIRIYEGLEE
uniref:V-type proton ATPase subunit a n=1 Tax=Acrobeloides nanus TaxID=290746 RepID=A0A914BYS9_9BILA